MLRVIIIIFIMIHIEEISRLVSSLEKQNY